MFKKFVSIGFMGLFAVLALSAFNSVSFQPASTNALSIAPKGFQTPLMSDFVPSLDATASLAISRQYEYGPASLATGAAAVSLGSRIVPLSEIFGLKAVPGTKVAVISRQYEYGPASLATGAAAASLGSRMVPLSEIFSLKAEPSTKLTVISRQYQYGPANILTGLAPHHMLNSGH